MRRLWCLVGLLLLAGCQNVRGPLYYARNPERVDDPRYDTREQAARARERLALPDESRSIAPNSGAAYR